MKRRYSAILFPAMAGLSLLLALLSACDLNVSGGDDVFRNIPADFSGFYSNPNGRITTAQTGSPITTLDLRQNGDRLEAVDNHGNIFRGKIGRFADSQASFILEGWTTAGHKAVMNGTLRGEGTAATLQGNWIEPSLTALVFAQATINPIPTNAPSGGDSSSLSIQPSGNITVSLNNIVTFTASGGSGSYQWGVNNQNLGFLSVASGSTSVYTPSRSGTQTVSVTDGNETVSTVVSH
ncbi:MAG: hypothetical protein VCG02_00615 [Verrucomicrobiota bacterium]